MADSKSDTTAIRILIATITNGQGLNHSFFPIPHLYLIVEVSERGVQVTVGGCGGLDGLRRGWLCPFFLAARIGEVEVHSVLHEFRCCRTSYDFGDGTAHHSDWYVRQIDSKLVLDVYKRQGHIRWLPDPQLILFCLIHCTIRYGGSFYVKMVMWTAGDVLLLALI